MAIEKNQNPGGGFGAIRWTSLPIQPIWPIFVMNGLNWQCYIAGRFKTATRILIFSIGMDAHYSFEVKNIEIWVPAFYKHNNSSAATVRSKFNQLQISDKKFCFHLLLQNNIGCCLFLNLVNTLIGTLFYLRPDEILWKRTLVGCHKFKWIADNDGFLTSSG